MSNEKREKGRALLEKLCGDADAINGFPDKFLDYTLEHLFGDVWQGDALELQERELVTCTILTALAREPEQRFHFTAARRLGWAFSRRDDVDFSSSGEPLIRSRRSSMTSR